jgi:hypothetical protein
MSRGDEDQPLVDKILNSGIEFFNHGVSQEVICRDLSNSSAAKFAMVVRFLAQVNFCSRPSCLKKWNSLQ